MVAGAFAGLGLAEGTAELLPGTTVIGGFAILMHGEAGLAEKKAGRQLGRVFGISLVERDDGFALVDVTNAIVDRLGIIAFSAIKVHSLTGMTLLAASRISRATLESATLAGVVIS